MKKLTLEDKQRIVAMLYEHYTIDSATMAVIDMAADSAEQMAELTLKAFSMAAKPIAEQKNPHAILQIDSISSKLQFIKAIKDNLNCDLAKARNLADCAIKDDCGTHVFLPFKIGTNEEITIKQWDSITSDMKHMDSKFGWHFL